MSSIHTSNDSLIYDIIRGGKQVRDNRDKFSIALQLGELECIIGEDYSPSFNLKEGHWASRINRNSLHYKRMTHTMYFYAFHWMNDNLPIIKRYRTNPSPSITADSMTLGSLDHYSRDYGEKFYMTIFLRALLKSDFADKANEMPDYIHNNNY
jgi:hypothetical protein